MGSEKLREGLLDLLLKVDDGFDTATKISVALQLPLTTITSSLKLLEKKGFLNSKKFFNKRVYELSPTGSRATTNFRDPTKVEARKTHKQVLAHKVSWSMKIVLEPAWLRDELRKAGFISNSHRNWLSLDRKFDDYTIAFHKNRVFVYFTEFSLPGGASDYFMLGNDKMSEVKAMLENQYKGLRLGDLRQHTKFRIHNQHIVERFGEVAMKFDKVRQETGSKLAYHGKNFSVDFSKGFPEQEFTSSSGAAADALQYAEFVDDFCNSPFRPQDVALNAQRIDSTALDVAGLKEDLKVVLSQNKSTSDVLKVFSESFERVSSSQAVEMEKLLAVQQAQAGSMNVFAKAMDEHVALVRELQGVTKALGEGLAQLRRPWFVRAWQGLKLIFKKKDL